MPENTKLTRRGFLKSTLATTAITAFPTIIPASARGADGAIAPSNRIVMGSIGVGGKGMGNTQNFLGHPEVQLVAICDVDAGRARGAARFVNRKYKNEDCASCTDFREVTRRDDIDAVLISTPDHWHTLPGIDAARHGKDMYIEKPLSLTIAEGRKLADTVNRYGRILQTGSQQRSDARFRLACELARNGRLGKLHTVEVGIPDNNRFCEPTWRTEPVPEGFDYDMWLGQAPAEPYHTQRCHYCFRFILDYSGGQVTNFGAHNLDIAQWGLGADDTGPVEVYGDGEFPTSGLFTTATRVYFKCTYANGVKLTCKTGKFGMTFIGTEGNVYVDRHALLAEPASLLHDPIGPDEIHLYESHNHTANFLQCVRSRRKAICHEEVGHRSASVCHLGNIAMQLGRTLKWDPKAERFIGDSDANRMVGRAMRAPWHL